MPYSPTTWVNNTTPLDATNMNKIEAGIAAAIPKDLADAKGDLIVASAADTVARLAAGAQGQVLAVGASSALGWEARVGYGTTANWPASPYDGQEYILVDSTSAPTYQWRFRYNAGGGTYKWEFVGGHPKVFNYYAGGALFNNAAFVTASGWYWWTDASGSVFPVPRSGDYLVRSKMSGENVGAAANNFITTAGVTTTPTISAYGQAAWLCQTGLFTISNGGLVTAAVAGTHSVGMAWLSSNAPGQSIYDAYVEITPVKVS